jgi:hypothetical protein
MTNGRKTNTPNFPFQGPPKFTQIGMFVMKRNHLAALRPDSSFSGCINLSIIATDLGIGVRLTG